MAGPRSVSHETAESVAIQALTFLGESPERMARFLALSGLAPERIRIAAAEPGFLAGVLDHVMGDEALLRAFADACGIDPAEVGRARERLAGPGWERAEP